MATLIGTQKADNRSSHQAGVSNFFYIVALDTSTKSQLCLLGSSGVVEWVYRNFDSFSENDSNYLKDSVGNSPVDTCVCLG
jgi:hypothetical protein